MCIKVMCREYTLFENNFSPKRSENIRDYIMQDVCAYESGAWWFIFAI